MLALIQESVRAGARLSRAVEVLGISLRTWQRWTRDPTAADSRNGPKTKPAHALSDEEKQAVLKLVNSAEFRNLSPEQVVAKAADEGVYVASERTIRRVLAQARLNTFRERNHPPQPSVKPRELVATRPLSVLCWDITYLRSSTVRGQYYYLYLFVDLWTRRIVGAEVHDVQSAALASQLLRRICEREDVEANMAVHADNGAPMKGSTMLATMYDLGIVKSFSRPGVSDDNPFIEALFRHLKYTPAYPGRGFRDLQAAREWLEHFVDWYNNYHLHSSIGFVTPQSRHDGDDIDQLENRRRIYAEARQRNPRRWTRHPRAWSRPQTVTLNPDRTVQTTPKAASPAA